jgi:hypothetical protein
VGLASLPDKAREGFLQGLLEALMRVACRQLYA